MEPGNNGGLPSYTQLRRAYGHLSGALALLRRGNALLEGGPGSANIALAIDATADGVATVKADLEERAS